MKQEVKMEDDIKMKSGKEIVDEFFNKITEIPGVDIELVSEIKRLYENTKLTETNIKHLLEKLFEKRKQEVGDEN